MKRLQGSIIEIKSLSKYQKQRMFELMKKYFYNVKRERFDRDLEEKNWVAILEDKNNKIIQGFSTLKVIEHKIEGIPIKAIFSGDTIIHKQYQGERELFRTVGQLFLSLIEKYKKEKLYWFLISMGYKTYLMLPLFFKKFYPRCDKTTPKFERKIIDGLGYLKYPLEYNSKTGIIHYNGPKEYLKSGVADMTDRILKNPNAKFFLKKNPFYVTGDELVCIAELSLENFRPVLCKIIQLNVEK